MAGVVSRQSGEIRLEVLEASGASEVGEYAIQADGDGVRGVHCNKRGVHCNKKEGIWTGLRRFLRPFRGISEWCEEQYVAMFQWGYNIKGVTDEFLSVMLGVGPHTDVAP
jgi:hypothetical protein